MTTQYRCQPFTSNSNLIEGNLHSQKTNPSKGGRSTRVPLRPRNFNVENNNNNTPSLSDPPQKPSRIQSKDPSQFTKNGNSSSRRSLKKDPELVEIEELRKKPNGEGHTIHRYRIGKMLGKGGFAKVYMCTSLDTNRNYAVKIVPKANLTKSRARQKLQAEIKIHRILKHKYICEYKHFFEDSTNCYILLELCHNQSMNELIKRRKRLTEAEVKYYLSQLVQSVHYMHSINVIHRDLKLGNLFLDKQLRIKVGDLGLATKLSTSDEKRKTICGTPNYIAPEVIDGDKEKRGHSFEVDVWSMGVICYTLLIGKPPYESKDVKSTYQRILANEYSFPSHVPMSEHARDLITRMLQTSPSLRPSLKQITQHPFFTHEASKIPKSLPSCCIHVAPDWQEDDHGNLVPILAEVDDNMQRSKSTSRRRSAYSSSTTRVRSPVKPGNEIKNENGYGSQASKGRADIYCDQNLNNDYVERRKSISTADAICIGSNANGERFDTESRVGSSTQIVPQARYELCDKKITSEKGYRDSTQLRERSGLSFKQDKGESGHNNDSSKPTNELPDRLQVDEGEVESEAINYDVQALEAMHMRLKEASSLSEKSVSLANRKFRIPLDFNEGVATAWVTKYVDYTSKYGLGFLLNDGSAGVYFNDATKAVLASSGDSFTYVERKKAVEGGKIASQQECEVYSLSSYPEELQKKVTLLKHFRNYLIEQQNRDEDKDVGACRDGVSEYKGPPIYLKKWVRTKHAILFRLSNKTVQVVFYDHTEILLSSEGRVVTYVDKRHDRTSHYLEDIMLSTQHADIKKRLKYVEGILHQLISGSQK